MSVTKIKIVYEDDIRMLKLKEISLDKIKEFVRTSHKDLEEFRLSFKDDEEDEITIVDDDDLKEALNSTSKTTKIFVKPVNDNNNEDEKEDLDETVKTNNVPDEDGEESEEEDEDEDYEPTDNFPGNNCKWLKFLDDISEDKELKEEFISFLTTFILSLQNEEDEEQQPGETNNGSQLFVQSLSLHKKLSKHETINKFVTEKLDILFFQFPHLLKILRQINVNDINKFIDIIIEFNNSNKLSPKSNNFPMLPPFLFPFLGLFNCKYQQNKCTNGINPPPFGLGPSLFGMFGGFRGGRRCHRGRHNKFGRHGHGHHHGHGRRHGNRHGHHHHHHHNRHHGFKPWNIFGNNNNNNSNNNNRCKKQKDLRADIVDENITLGKNAFVNGNQTLIKTWKMKNVGKKEIPENCQIQYFGKRFNPMIDGTKFELKNKSIKIGDEFECSVAVRSPKKNGRYASKWKLVTKDGKKFGQALFVSFIVNDDNNNNNNQGSKVNKKEEKKIVKQEKKLIKKEKKLLKKEQKQQKHKEKLDRKKEKLRVQREKLLEKLELLEKQSNNLNRNISNDNNNHINNDDDEKEILNDSNITIEDEVDEEQNSNNNNNNNNVIEEDDIVIVKETSEGDGFMYGEQLDQLKSMGFNDENQLRKLLEINNGSIQQVLNQIMS